MGDHVTDRPASPTQRWAIANVLVSAMLDAPISFTGADVILKTKTATKKMAGEVLGAIGIRLTRKHPAAELLEQYFREVFGHTLDLSGVLFPYFSHKSSNSW